MGTRSSREGLWGTRAGPGQVLPPLRGGGWVVEATGSAFTRQMPPPCLVAPLPSSGRRKSEISLTGLRASGQQSLAPSRGPRGGSGFSPASRVSFLFPAPSPASKPEAESLQTPPPGKFFLLGQISLCFSPLKTLAGTFTAQWVIQENPNQGCLTYSHPQRQLFLERPRPRADLPSPRSSHSQCQANEAEPAQVQM